MGLKGTNLGQPNSLIQVLPIRRSLSNTELVSVPVEGNSVLIFLPGAGLNRPRGQVSGKGRYRMGQGRVRRVTVSEEVRGQGQLCLVCT